MAVLLPTIRGTIARGRQVACQVSLRSVAHDFLIFADDQFHVDRGDDASMGERFFRIETFQESEYQVDEFWAWGEVTDYYQQSTARRNDPMRCAEVRGAMELRRNTACSRGAVGPRKNVSFGFNMRLHWAEFEDSQGLTRVRLARLTEQVRDEGMVPLAWDVDGAQANRRDSEPVFSAPPLSSRGPYASGRYWYPSRRHLGATNVAFIGGQVLSTRDPLGENGWRWDYQPPVR